MVTFVEATLIIKNKNILFLLSDKCIPLIHVMIKKNNI